MDTDLVNIGTIVGNGTTYAATISINGNEVVHDNVGAASRTLTVDDVYALLESNIGE